LPQVLGQTLKASEAGVQNASLNMEGCEDSQSQFRLPSCTVKKVPLKSSWHDSRVLSPLSTGREGKIVGDITFVSWMLSMCKLFVAENEFTGSSMKAMLKAQLMTNACLDSESVRYSVIL
jgi:hypothetical protein